MQIIGLISGGLLLAFGRRLFWLFVAVVGFFAGTRIAESLFPTNPNAALFTALLLGLVGAGLAVFFQRIAILVAGFIGGGLVLSALVGLLVTNQPGVYWVAFLIGGILGIILLNAVFDWTLIILSSLLGAVLVANYSKTQAPLSTLLLVGLFILGMVLQSGVVKFGR
jgi:hypothetical protein